MRGQNSQILNAKNNISLSSHRGKRKPQTSQNIEFSLNNLKEEIKELKKFSLIFNELSRCVSSFTLYNIKNKSVFDSGWFLIVYAFLA